MRINVLAKFRYTYKTMLLPVIIANKSAGRIKFCVMRDGYESGYLKILIAVRIRRCHQILNCFVSNKSGNKKDQKDDNGYVCCNYDSLNETNSTSIPV